MQGSCGLAGHTFPREEVGIEGRPSLEDGSFGGHARISRVDRVLGTTRPPPQGPQFVAPHVCWSASAGAAQRLLLQLIPVRGALTRPWC